MNSASLSTSTFTTQVRAGYLRHVRCMPTHLLLVVFVLACSCAVAVSGCNAPPPSGWPQPYTDQQCTVSLDLTLVLDYSRSIWEQHPTGSWQNMLRFAQRFVSKFTSRETRFSIITFNNDANIELGFTSDKQQVLGKLQCMMNYGKPNGWGTDIGKALRVANGQASMPNHVSVYLVITDGHEEFYNGQSTIMMSERAVAIQRGVHIATVQVGNDAVAKQELTSLASTPDFYTTLPDFPAFEDPSQSLEKQIFLAVCLSVSGVLPTVITVEESRHPDMRVDVAGTALCAASIGQYNAAYVSLDKNPYETTVLYSVRPCVFDVNAYRLHCSMPQGGLQAGGRYRVELQNVASLERTINSLAVLAVSASSTPTTGPAPQPPSPTEMLILGFTVVNFCILLGVILFLAVVTILVVRFLRRHVDGRPRWHNYRDSVRSFYDRRQESFRSWRSKSPNTHHHPPASKPASKRASQDIETGYRAETGGVSSPQERAVYSDSIMGLPPRASAVPATAPKKMSVVYTPPPVVETEMVCPSSRSPSNEEREPIRHHHHSRSPTSTSPSRSPPPRYAHHHHHDHSRDLGSHPAHHGHHNSMPDSSAAAIDSGRQGNYY